MTNANIRIHAASSLGRRQNAGWNAGSADNKPMRLIMLLTILTAAGCSFHKPGGTLFRGTGDTTTIESTERVQKSVTLVDIRSGEILVSIDVPIGKQLTWDIVPGWEKIRRNPRPDALANLGRRHQKWKHAECVVSSPMPPVCA